MTDGVGPHVAARINEREPAMVLNLDALSSFLSNKITNLHTLNAIYIKKAWHGTINHLKRYVCLSLNNMLVLPCENC